MVDKKARAAANKKYYEANKERLQAERRARYAEHAKNPVRYFEVLLAAANQRARRKGLPATVTLPWLLERYTGKCEATGVDLRLTGETNDPFAPSLDRIDITKGYTHKNVRITCQIFNLARNVYNDEDLLVMARGLIHKHEDS
jgi:hypothetical protein